MRDALHNKHLLSLKDLNQSEVLEELLDAGATSLKIEGRLKDVTYVKNGVCFPVYNPPLLGRWVSYLAFSAIPLNRGRPGVLRQNSNSQCKTVGF